MGEGTALVPIDSLRHPTTSRLRGIPRSSNLVNLGGGRGPKCVSHRCVFCFHLEAEAELALDSFGAIEEQKSAASSRRLLEEEGEENIRRGMDS